MTKAERKAQAEFHARMSEHHDKISGNHGKLREHFQETHPEVSACHAALEAHHKALSAEHAAEAQRHLDCMKAASDEIEKADGGELVTEMRELVKALRGSVAPMPARLSLIPRFNARDPRAEKADASKVDPMLRRAIVDETEQQPASVAFNQTQ